MRVSYEWLKDLVDLPADPQRLVDEFTRTGTEVEGVERTGAEFDHIVTGQITSKEPHPNSDHMWLCKVQTDEPEPLQIVCGAPNCRAGLVTALAHVGAKVPENGETLKKGRLRGVDLRLGGIDLRLSCVQNRLRGVRRGLGVCQRGRSPAAQRVAGVLRLLQRVVAAGETA